MDAITLLRNDHRTVEKLFKRFEKAGEQAFVEKRAIVDGIIEELAVHASIEEQVFYPVCRATVPGVEDLTLESLEEHHVVKWLLDELDGLDAEAERFEAKTTVLMEMVRHHVEEEESDLFPKVRNALGRRALSDLGSAMAEAKTTAPTKPHPRSPDTPQAGGAVMGAVAGVLDRVSDNVGGVAQGTVTAVQDLIARIRGNDRPKVSPTGSSTTRTRAKQVRRAAGEATDAVSDTVRKAAAGADDTRRAASAGAKATRTTAKKSAKATATSAKKSAKATATTAKGAATRTTNAARQAASSTASSAAKGAKKTSAAARKRS